MPKSFNTGRQLDIYRSGIAPEDRLVPFDHRELRAEAERNVERRAWNFVDGGAGGEATMRANLTAFDRWRIMPRMLRDVAERDLSVELLGERLPHPILVAPIGVQADFHPEGELATARGAAEAGALMVLSGVSSTPMEDVAAACGDGAKWFQLYWPKDPELTASFLSRAEASCFTAIMVTLDTQTLGWRPRDLGAPHLPFLLGHGLGNYFSDPVFRSRLAVPPEEDLGAAVDQYLDTFSNPAHRWEDLEYVRQHTRLPIILKGIQHPDDARRAVEFGADAVVVSNHGGRQVDGAIGSLEALPMIVEAVGGRVPVLFDSGVRGGADVYKALALGAAAVLVGRPYMWGLAIAGGDGVREVLLNMVAELDLTMALSGRRCIGEIGREDLWRVE